MVRSKILTKTVLLLLVCHTAQSLETGCLYQSNVSIEKDVLHFDLKCAYLYSGLTHMLITKQLTFFLSPSVLIGKITRYVHTLKCQIYSLYHLKAMRMDALWLIHLYMGLFPTFYKSLEKIDNGRKIIDTLDYVVAQVRKDLKDCRKDNIFNDEEMIFSNVNLSKDDWRSFLYTNNTKARKLLTSNNICDQTFDGVIGKTLQIGSLLLNKIGSNDSIDSIYDLMNVFNVQVEWNSTGELLEKSWSDGRINFWTNVKFVSLKLYYKLTFNFLKVIMLRLTLKHLHYLEPFSGNVALYVRYAKEWYYKVQQFGEILSLSEDLHVKNLLDSFDNLIKQEEKIENVANYLIVILNELCLSLGCVATRPFKLNEKEFEKPFKSTVTSEYFKIQISPVPIEYRSLENTRVFLSYLSWVFKYVDFKLVHSFIEYINEVDLCNYIDGLENQHQQQHTFNFDYII